MEMPDAKRGRSPGADMVLGALAFVACMAMGCTHFSQSQPSTPVASWPGEGSAGDSVGQCHGQVVGRVEFGPGRKGQAFKLGAGSYVLIPTTRVLDVGKGRGFTIEGWINPDGLSRPMPIVEYERTLGSGVGTDVGVHLYISLPPGGGTGPGCLYAHVVGVDGAVDHTLSSPPHLVVADVWQHVALSYDQASGFATILLNGAVVAQTNFGSFTPETSCPYLLIGARTAFGSAERPSDSFSGLLDEIGIHDRALSPREVRAICSDPGIQQPILPRQGYGGPAPDIQRRTFGTMEGRATRGCGDGSTEAQGPGSQ